MALLLRGYHLHCRNVGFWRWSYHRPLGSELIFSARLAWWNFQLWEGPCALHKIAATSGNNQTKQRKEIPSFPLGAADRTAAPL